MTTGLSPADLASYHALRTGAVWFDLPVAWVSMRGANAAVALNGLVTNDVAALAAGETQFAAALSPKGKMLCDLFVLRVNEEEFLVGAHETAVKSWLSLLKKYVNPRLCTITDESALHRTLLIAGAKAERAADAVRGLPADDGRGWLHVTRAPTPSAPTPGSATLVIAPSAGTDTVMTALADSAVHGSPAVWTIARIESGWPEWGSDIDENTIPQEANLDALGAISFTKGCYTGQETVARIHFRGHVNRHLLGLSSEVLLERGAAIVDASGKVVGDVRSTAVSPRLGPIAIGMIRREVTPGTEVTVRTNAVSGEDAEDGARDGGVTARVVSLPFAG